MEHFKQPEQFISLNGQIIALPVEPENPLRTAEMTVEDNYGMIDGVINNGRKGEELEAAKDAAFRLGVSRGIDPFMTLSFMALPVIPTLRITTRGVIDVNTQQYI